MAKEQAPAFQFYPREFLADPRVVTLSPEAVGAYILLLCYCWSEQQLENDHDTLRKLARCSKRQWDRIGAVVLGLFEFDGTAYRHKRLDKERASQEAFRTGQSEHGKAGARARWGHGKPIAPPMPNDASSSASSSASAEEINTYTAPVVMPFRDKRLTVEEVFGPSGSPVDPAAEHVASVMAAWSEEYSACRLGAIFQPHPIRDYAVFKELADTYADVAHLRQMFRFFFLADDLPEYAQARSPKAFLRLAPETDAAVRRSA